MSVQRRGWSRIGLTITVLSAVMCAEPDTFRASDAQPGADSDGLGGAGQVTYHLVWDWGDAVPTEAGWRVLTDRGFEVEVTEGYLSTYSVQLAPCTDTDLSQGRPWADWLGVRFAHAGHGGPEDPSAWLTGIAESLVRPEAHQLDTVMVGSGHYCRLHYLVARAETSALDLPQDFNLVGTSLYVAGTVTDPAGVTAPFSIWSTLPTAQLVAWAEPVKAIDLSRQSVDVTVTRDLGRLFDGVDFGTMSDESIQKTLLLGFAERVKVAVH